MDEKTGKILGLLSEFRGLKKIPGILGGRGQSKLTEIQNEAGEIDCGRNDIAETFASFYKNLYAT